MNTIYLLHFEPPFRHAKHYLGIVRNGRNLTHRWIEHKAGGGAVLTRHTKNAGSLLILTRIWQNVPFRYEAELKRRGKSQYCPVCKRKKLDKKDNT